MPFAFSAVICNRICNSPAFVFLRQRGELPFFAARSGIFPKLGLHLTKLRAIRGERLDLPIRQMFK